MFKDIEKLVAYGAEKKKLNELIHSALIHFANIDENFHDNEKHFINQYADNHNVKVPYHQIAIPNDYKRSKKAFEKIISKIKALDLNTHYSLFTLLHFLHELADSDNLLEEQEAELINLIKSHIKPNTVASNFILDEKQQEIINLDQDARITVSALPGSGKTDVIARRVQKLYEIDRVRANEIMLISFTNNAVKEMKIRLAKIMGKKFPAGIKVLTLDKYATSSNFAMDPKHDLISFSHNMRAFLNHMLDEEKTDWREQHRELRHIFIDEAQDLVGGYNEPRRSVCEELIKLADKDCGVTICGDLTQQIYPFKNSIIADDDKSLLAFAYDYKEFTHFELSKIYRSKKADQLDFIEDTALEIMLLDNNDSDSVNNPLVEISKKEEDVEIIDAVDNYMFLFRWNKDLINSCANLQDLNKNFRLTPGKIEPYYEQWVASFFQDSIEKNLQEISREEFNEFFKSQSSRMQLDKSSDEMWQLIYNYASSGPDSISLELFYEQLKKTRGKLIDFTSKDIGFRGPKLSTIHAAKGSQEQNISIHEYKEVQESSLKSTMQAKLLFVALSRAQNKVQVLKDSGTERSWRKNGTKRHYSIKKADHEAKRHALFMELGIDGDYSPIEIVSNKINEDEVIATQEVLKKLYIGNDSYSISGRRNNFKKRFNLFLEYGKREYMLGSLSADVNIDLNFLGSHRNFIPKGLQEKFTIPNEINDIKLMDIGSYIASADELDDLPILNKYKELGCWHYPIIYSIQRFIFKKR